MGSSTRVLGTISALLVMAMGACGGEMSTVMPGAQPTVAPGGNPPPAAPGAWQPAPTTPPPFPICAEQTGEAKLIGGGVDIIWFIDTSGSMLEETQWVQQNINNFAQFIGSQNLDYRVILVAEKYKQILIIEEGICVPPPLAGPDCKDGPRFRHVKEKVSSTNGLQVLIEMYPKYQDFLRPGATVNFVAVSDDNSAKDANWFEAELGKLTNPGFAAGFIFHSIVSLGSDPKKGCHTGARYGKVYEELSQRTGGSMFQVCQTDWKPIFDSLARSVVQNAKPPCSYQLPTPPDGQTIKPNQIRVNYLTGGQTIGIPRVDNAAACGDTRSFYYDNNESPTVVVFCPSTCAAMQGGQIHISYGCLELN